jgi:recombination protein RecA
VLRFGAETPTETALLPTGIIALDDVLGGLPRGALTELLGAPTSGMTTLALTAIAHTQATGALAAFIDVGGTFDSAYAAACGVDLSGLLLARPTSAPDVLELVEALVASGALSLLLVDSLAWLPGAPGGHALLSTALRRITPVLARSPTALVALTFLPYPAAVASNLVGRGSPLAHAAALRLHVARGAWAVTQGQAPGADAHVLVMKRRGAPDGAHFAVPVVFPSDWGTP